LLLLQYTKPQKEETRGTTSRACVETDTYMLFYPVRYNREDMTWE